MPMIIDPLSDMQNALLKAKQVLERGGLVAIPSETVYGLGANAYSQKGVKAVYKAKNRAQDNPLICHVSNLKMLEQIAILPPKKEVEPLMKAFWPGPLTLILNRKPGSFLYYVNDQHSTVAVRIPSHPFFLKLIEYCGFPIVAPSANISGRPSGTRWDIIKKEFQNKIDLIIKWAPSEIGIESTVLDLTQASPAILRQGFITLSDIKAILPLTVQIKEDQEYFKENIVKSPGTKYKHYQPSFPITLCLDQQSFVEALETINFDLEKASVITPEQSYVELPKNLLSHQQFKDGKDLAHNLYAWFYDLEAKGTSQLLILFKALNEFDQSLKERLVKSSSNVVGS